MKLIFILICSAILNAEASLPLESTLAQSPITINCAYVDMTNWPAVFRAASGFRCLISTSTPDAVAFQVSITTRGEAIHVYKIDRTAIQHGYSLAVFPTQDRELTSVSVAEIKANVVFSAEVE